MFRERFSPQKLVEKKKIIGVWGHLSNTHEMKTSFRFIASGVVFVHPVSYGSDELWCVWMFGLSNMRVCDVSVSSVWSGEHQESRITKWEPPLYEGTSHTHSYKLISVNVVWRVELGSCVNFREETFNKNNSFFLSRFCSYSLNPFISNPATFLTTGNSSSCSNSLCVCVFVSWVY